MKKIVVFSNMYPSSEHPTFGIFVEKQVALLRSAGLDIDVVVNDNPGRGKVIALKKYMTWFARSIGYMVKNRRQLTLTHAHYAFPTGVISLIGKKMMGIPYVVTVHGGDIDKMAAKSTKIALITKKILQQAVTVIVVGEKLKNDVITKFGVSQDCVHVMSMGVDTSLFKSIPKEEARNSLEPSVDHKVIVFIGNVIREKGVLELIEAFEILKKSHSDSLLYIIGSQKDANFVAEIQSFIQSKAIQDIHFKQPLGQADLAKWMSASDVLALPSYHEGFGLVALEAMASGTIVVGSDVGGLSYLLQDGAGILVEPKNPVSLASGLQLAIESPTTSINEEIVLQKVATHSFDTILQDLLQIYRAVEESRVGRHE